MSRILKAFSQQKTSIRRVIAKYRPNPADIDEVEQDVFLTCYALELKEEIIEPDHLLLRVAKNLSINQVQKKSTKALKFLPDNDSLSAFIDEQQVSAEQRVSDRQRLKIFAEALASVPEKDQRIFVMRRIEGLKSAQIATRLNISVRTVERRAAAALLHCYRYLKVRGYDPSDIWMPEQITSEQASPNVSEKPSEQTLHGLKMKKK